MERGGRGRGDDGVRSSALGGRDERAAAMGEKRQKRAHRTGREEQEEAPIKPVRTSQCQMLEMRREERCAGNGSQGIEERQRQGSMGVAMRPNVAARRGTHRNA